VEKPDVIIVTPIYEDKAASDRLFLELGRLFGDRVYVIAVDDGSVRQPIDASGLVSAGLRGTVVTLRRNVGHQRAIAIGLSVAGSRLQNARAVVVMDSDGEDRPETIKTLLDTLDQQDVDIAVAQRLKRVESVQFKLFYAAYKLVFRALSGRTINYGNFMAIKPHVVNRLTTMQELSIHVAAAVLASKLRIAVCPINRGERYAGLSKMNFVGLTLHGFKALMVFAEDVLVHVGIACALIGAAAIFGTIMAFILKMVGISTPGWFSIALGILLLIFLQTGMLALMTLMLTGVVRSGTVTSTVTYAEFIEKVTDVDGPAVPA
jgi:hypothetical protein